MITGLYAAAVTPFDERGQLDLEAIDRIVDLTVAAGVSGVCIAGATGEYPHFEVADRKRLIARAAARLPRECGLLVGIGAPSMRLSIELGEAAMAAGCRGLLLPMPMFFRYQQADLEAFATHVSDALNAPCLLYNLPVFTNGLSVTTMIRVLGLGRSIVGVKDSSGEVPHLEALVQARADRPWSLLVGDDRLFRDGLIAGWNGGISGVAGFCPELLVAIYRSFMAGRLDETARFQTLLDELIVRIVPFPTPWAVKIGLAARGLETGPLPLPLTAARQQQVAEFKRWFPVWLQDSGLVTQ